MIEGKAFDCSNYSGTVKQEQADCIHGDGYTLAVCGTYDPVITRQQLGVFKNAGFKLQAYVYLEFQHPIVPQVDAALQACSPFPIEYLWLDCEDPYAEQLTEAQTLEDISVAAARCIGRVYSGIYTRLGWWERQTGNSSAFKGFLLWDAHYRTPPVPHLLPAGYGGWTLPWMQQYQANQPLCGVNVDLDVYQIPDPPPSDKDQLIAHLEASLEIARRLP